MTLYQNIQHLAKDINGSNIFANTVKTLTSRLVDKSLSKDELNVHLSFIYFIHLNKPQEIEQYLSLCNKHHFSIFETTSIAN